MCCLNLPKIRALQFSGRMGIVQCKEGHNIVSISSCPPVVLAWWDPQGFFSRLMGSRKLNVALAQSVLFRLAGPAGKIATTVNGRGRPSRNEFHPSWEAKEFFGIPIFAVFLSAKGPGPD